MWSYEQHPSIRATGKHLIGLKLEHFATVERNGWSCDSVTLSTLTGTYFETKAHMMPGPTIDSLPLETFFRDASILQLPDKSPRGRITLEEVRRAGGHVRSGDAVLFSCGWDKQWNRAGFVENSPTLSLDAMNWLINTEPSIIGGDVPCFDDPHGSSGGTVQAMFQRGIHLLAPLVNLRSVKSERARLVALPLNVRGVCGFPCRAVIIED